MYWKRDLVTWKNKKKVAKGLEKYQNTLKIKTAARGGFLSMKNRKQVVDTSLARGFLRNSNCLVRIT